MPDHDIETLKMLFHNLREDFSRSEENLRVDMDKNFNELKVMFREYATQTNAQESKIVKIETQIDELQRDNKKNFEQHEVFYSMKYKIYWFMGIGSGLTIGLTIYNFLKGFN